MNIRIQEGAIKWKQEIKGMDDKRTVKQVIMPHVKVDHTLEGLRKEN